MGDEETKTDEEVTNEALERRWWLGYCTEAKDANCSGWVPCHSPRFGPHVPGPGPGPQRPALLVLAPGASVAERDGCC